jgi:hypothetical protein
MLAVPTPLPKMRPRLLAPKRILPLRLKSESSKRQPPKNNDPFSINVHNPKATHPEWKCFKLTDEQHIAAQPTGKGKPT